jgi:hypothetical protein
MIARDRTSAGSGIVKVESRPTSLSAALVSAYQMAESPAQRQPQAGAAVGATGRRPGLADSWKSRPTCCAVGQSPTCAGRGGDLLAARLPLACREEIAAVRTFLISEAVPGPRSPGFCSGFVAGALRAASWGRRVLGGGAGVAGHARRRKRRLDITRGRLGSGVGIGSVVGTPMPTCPATGHITGPTGTGSVTTGTDRQQFVDRLVDRDQHGPPRSSPGRAAEPLVPVEVDVCREHERWRYATAYRRPATRPTKRLHLSVTAATGSAKPGPAHATVTVERSLRQRDGLRCGPHLRATPLEQMFDTC